jgi:hypothetical protein
MIDNEEDVDQGKVESFELREQLDTPSAVRR